MLEGRLPVDGVTASSVAGVSVRWAEGAARIRMDGGAGPFTLTVESAAALLDAWRWAEGQGASIVVISSAANAWCVGGDISVFAAAEDPARYIDDLAEALHRIVSEITRSAAVCVAAIDGVVAGAGTPLAAAADLLVATDRARFTLGYTRLGLSPDGGTSLLSSSLGLHGTLHAALLNPVWSAHEAQRRGLVAEVVPAEGLDEAIESIVAALASQPAAALAATKRLIRHRAAPDAEAAMRRESLELRALASTPEAAEGFAAFVDKRPPRFRSLGRHDSEQKGPHKRPTVRDVPGSTTQGESSA